MSTGQDFRDFYVATWPRLLRTTYAVTGDRQLAEDALQSAFAKAYANWGRVSRANEPVAYVRRIAINSAIAQGRRAWNKRESTVAEVPEPLSDGHLEVVERDAMWTAITQLPPRQRAIVVLRYYEDLSEVRIAEVLGCRPGTVKSQASAALSHLRTLLAATSTDGGLP